MRQQQDTTSILRYGREIIDTIKKRNTIDATTAELEETLYIGSTNHSLSAFSTTKFRILFTPDFPGNSYAEVGVSKILIGIGSAFFDYAVYRDPDFVSTTKSAWLFIIYVEASCTLVLNSSVISAPQGTITQVRLP